jgi:hypothetical protein
MLHLVRGEQRHKALRPAPHVYTVQIVLLRIDRPSIFRSSHPREHETGSLITDSGGWGSRSIPTVAAARTTFPQTESIAQRRVCLARNRFPLVDARTIGFPAEASPAMAFPLGLTAPMASG